MSSPYFDKRSDFFRREFADALSFDDYVEAAEALHQEKWRARQAQVKLTEAESSLLGTFKRAMNVLVLSGIWCGDCSRQGPILHAIADACPNVTLRFAENRVRRELQEELRINGAEKVPVVLVLSEDFYELSRFGDRHLSVYRKKALSELGPSCELGILPPTEDALRAETEEWIAHFERIQIMLRLAPALRKRYND